MKMFFKCLTKGHKFSLDKPEEIEGAWAWSGTLACPLCGSKMLQEEAELPVKVGEATRDLNVIRKENREHTAIARRQASEAMAIEKEINPDVQVVGAPNGESPSQFATGPMTVKKSILESIDQKAPSDYKNN